MIERCLKQNGGSCINCPAFQQEVRFIRVGKLYQDSMYYLRDHVCPPGKKPDEHLVIGKGGAVTQVVLEGQKL